jgi:hypothetical protein
MVKNLAARKAVEKTRHGKVQNRLSHRAWKSRQHPRDSHFPTASAAAVYKTNSCRTDGDISVEVNWGTFLSSYDKEIFERLTPSGVFCNLEHVASPTVELHHQFLNKLDIEPSAEDPSNKLLDLEIQLSWLREIGFVHVDCLWKWRELALMVGARPV